MVGKGRRGHVVTAAVHHSNRPRLRCVPRKPSGTVDGALAHCKEFSGHREVGEALGAGVYLAKPYSSQQQVLNEHANGLIRQCLC